MASLARALITLAYGDCPGRRRVDRECADIGHPVQQVNHNGQHKRADQNPGAAGGGSWNEQKYGADDLTPSQYQAQHIRHVSLGEIMARARHQDKYSFNQNYHTQSPLQTGQGGFHAWFGHKEKPFYFSAPRLRAVRPLISLSR